MSYSRNDILFYQVIHPQHVFYDNIHYQIHCKQFKITH